jgi:putative phosphotransacetylase
MGYKVKVGTSNKHLHLSRKHLDALFGEGHELTLKAKLVQPGQFATEERVTLVGPKRSFENIRIIGPTRDETQVELSMTDARTLGIDAPIRESGKLEGTPGIKIVGPRGEIEIDHGVIVAQRHIHLNPEQAKESGLENGQIVKIKCAGERALVFDEVVVRSGEKHERECHIDTDEANAAKIGTGDEIEVV